ncbi:anthrax toxin lethal factor-related metalloendopeptidase [Salinicoccus sp. HZC-1]|uniref:anthrax toxin lethal factor-related metalloendopeptidase n=1 Tax=Salinicoccus sp. HZC-1 TaxID=3385497 RepID=UPI00398AFD08
MRGHFLGKFSLIIVAVFFLALAGTCAQTASANSASLNNMIEIRTNDGSYDSAEAQAMVNRLSRVDDRILYQTNRAGVEIILMDMPLTELPEFEYLSGVVPRGWEDTGKTWDEVPGAGGFTVAARIGYSNPGNGHSTINLELHEYGHAVDSYSAGFTVSESEEFRQIMANEKNALFGDHAVPGYFDTPGEYFAEVFAMYYLGGEARNKLATRAPQTYDFISTFHNRLISIGEVTGNTAQFSWDALEGASTYEIYRNDEKIGETSSSSYEDTSLNTSTNYNYYVRALDASGNPLLTSYFRTLTTHTESDEPEVDTGELENLIAEVEAVNKEDRSPELQSALENANAVAADTDATQEQADEAMEALSSALEANTAEKEATEEEPAEAQNEEATGETAADEETSEEQTAEESTEEQTSEGATEGESAEAQNEESAEETAADEETSEEQTEEPEEETSEESAEESSENVETESETDSAQAETENNNLLMILLSIVLVILAIISAILLWMKRK